MRVKVNPGKRTVYMARSVFWNHKWANWLLREVIFRLPHFMQRPFYIKRDTVIISKADE